MTEKPKTEQLTYSQMSMVRSNIYRHTKQNTFTVFNANTQYQNVHCLFAGRRLATQPSTAVWPQMNTSNTPKFGYATLNSHVARDEGGAAQYDRRGVGIPATGASKMFVA
jgi:hypothetical protein